MISYLFGIRDVGNTSDFAKIRNYGFFYWFHVCDDDDLKDHLNRLIFWTLQEITLEEWSVQIATRGMYSNVQIAQPVPGGIGETFTLRYLSLIEVDPNGNSRFDIANQVFATWMYDKILSRERGFLVTDINPLVWTAAGGYILLSPDLNYIWGGEIFNGIVLEGYSHNLAYTSGTTEIRSIEARFRYLERWPVLSDSYNLSWKKELLEFANEIAGHARELLDPNG
ncbi:MAG: hypothetical protein QXW35_04580 [Candidatus Aenigmatarchaeota archaeon]